MDLGLIILGLAAVALFGYSQSSFADIPPTDYAPTEPGPDQIFSTPPEDWGLSSMSSYDQIIATEADPPPASMSFADFVRLINAVIQVESAWNPSAVSSVGAIGLMQVMPANAIAYGYQPADLYNPAINIKLGVDILRQDVNAYGMRDGLAAYNGGPKNRTLAVTQQYAAKVMSTGGFA